MTERPTTELKTTNGHTAVLLEYLTGRELRSIQETVMKPSRFEHEGKEVGISGETVMAMQDRCVNLAVKSLDGSTENIKERLEDLRAVDYQEIVDAAVALANDFLARSGKK